MGGQSCERLCPLLLMGYGSSRFQALLSLAYFLFDQRPPPRGLDVPHQTFDRGHNQCVATLPTDGSAPLLRALRLCARCFDPFPGTRQITEEPIIGALKFLPCSQPALTDQLIKTIGMSAYPLQVGPI